MVEHILDIIKYRVINSSEVQQKSVVVSIKIFFVDIKASKLSTI
jgi:hypothetical protein